LDGSRGRLSMRCVTGRPEPEASVFVSGRMDRELLKQHLQETEKRVAASEKLIADQQALIARLEDRGYDTAQSKTTLAYLEKLRELHIADRDRLARVIRELAE